MTEPVVETAEVTRKTVTAHEAQARRLERAMDVLKRDVSSLPFVPDGMKDAMETVEDFVVARVAGLRR